MRLKHEVINLKKKITLCVDLSTEEPVTTSEIHGCCWCNWGYLVSLTSCAAMHWLKSLKSSCDFLWYFSSLYVIIWSSYYRFWFNSNRNLKQIQVITNHSNRAVFFIFFFPLHVERGTCRDRTSCGNLLWKLEDGWDSPVSGSGFSRVRSHQVQRLNWYKSQCLHYFVFQHSFHWENKVAFLNVSSFLLLI